MLKNIEYKRITYVLRQWYLEAIRDCLHTYKKTNDEVFLNAAKEYGLKSAALKEELDNMKI